MDPVRVALAVQEGYSIVCATCTKFWQGRDAGLDRCTSRTGCAGPLAGRSFHDYEGPIQDFAEWCFVCGQRSTHAVRPSRGTRTFGVCTEHLPLLAQLEPVSQESDPIRAVISDNRLIPIEQLVAPRKPTLFEEMSRPQERSRVRRKG